MFKNLLTRLLPATASPSAVPTVSAAAPAGVSRPDDVAGADGLIVEGNGLEDAGRLAEAEALYRQAVATAPRHARAHLNLGIVLDARGDADGAAAAFETVLAIDPRHPFGNYNLARLMVVRRDTARARTLVVAALQARPDFLQALQLLGRIERDEGFAEEGLDAVARVLEHDPADRLHRSFELMILNNVEGVQPDAFFRKHVEFGAALEQAVPERFHHRPEASDPARRLRVGYLSGDFTQHPVAFFLAPVLERHERAHVETFCYSLTGDSDAMTQRLRAAAHHWRDVAALPDDALADVIHADGIDVLVDLMGHSSMPRPGVFCQRPARVQVAWLGYLNTTGLTRMDFRLTDVRCDPPAIAQPLHTERLVPLPASQWCYPGDDSHAIDLPPPFERNGHVTFGSFNSALKVTPAGCRRWAEVLLRVPGSRLVIGDVGSERKRAAIRRDITSLGVAEHRIEFMPRVPGDQYMRLYNAVDITLDTFPYGGGTTTFDSLWMGVPVVATRGDTSVSRSAAAILAMLDLEDWIAPAVGDVVDLAVARATDLEALRALRPGLRARLQASPLTDMARYVRDLEAAYREMWLEKAR